MGASSAQSGCAPSVAVAFGPVGDDADLARSAFCSLAAAARLAATSRPRTTDARYFRRPMLGRSDSVSHERHSRTWASGTTWSLTFPRAECAHLCGLWGQAGGVFLQSRRRQSSGGLGRTQLLQLALFSRRNVFQGTGREYSIWLPPSPWRCRVSWTLPPQWRNAPARNGVDRK